ncbi:hypothetical protein GCM10010400_12670 [Streptomyces aculeolatus]|uniref:hypothetical protein n=1 Tax=Streptomyces aculeolatus TaxID=270689 RepID=UPI001CED2F3C|nr:hypothetical protein [Streptomyces aculeolatus]
MIRTAVPCLLTLVLVVIGILHFVWAFAPWPWPWPWRDKVTFTRTIAGSDAKPAQKP